MNLINRIGNAMERAAYSMTIKAAAMARRMESFLSQAFMPKWAQPPRRSQGEWLKMSTTSPWVYASERPIGYAVATAKMTLWASAEKKKQIQKHPLLDLLNDPNPYMSRYDMFYLSDVWSTLAGEWFWAIERNPDTRKPWQLWPVPPSWVRDTPTLAMPFFVIQLQGYGFSGQTFPVPKEDVIWFKHPDPADPYGRGKGPAEACADEVETDEFSAKHDKSFYYNSAVPGVVITYPAGEALRAGEAEQLTQSWSERFQGFWKAFKPAVLTKGADVKVLGQTRKDNEHLESRRFRGQLIGGVIGTPKMLMGFTEDQNRSTAETTIGNWKEFTVTPHLFAIENVLNTRYVSMFKPSGMFLELEKPENTDKDFLDTQIREDVKAGLLTVYEARALRGYEADEKTKYYLVPNGYRAVQDFAMIPIGTNEPVRPELSMKALPPHTTKERSPEGGDEFIDAVLSPVDETAAYFEASMLPVYQEALVAAGESAVAEVLDAALFVVENPFVQEFLAEMEPRIKEISQVTYDRLKDSLLAGYRAGEGVTELIDRVVHEMGIAKDFRSENIARTESTGAMTGGQMLGYQQAKVPYKGWLATNDERTRITHLDAQTKYLVKPIPMMDDFKVGDAVGKCPGRMSTAKESCMCRCSLMPMYEEDVKELAGADLIARDERFCKALEPHEAKMKKTVRRLFLAQEAEILENLKKWGGA